VFALCRGQCQLYIELKSPHCVPAVAEEIKRQLQQGWLLRDIFVCAFDHRQLVDIARHIPGLQTCALIAGIPVSLAAIASEAGAMAINPNIHHMDAALVADAHARGLKVVTWTANSLSEIAHAKALGVDGIISDFPDRI
jgi:glycerophosphoryl diester phosphodiesterase